MKKLSACAALGIALIFLTNGCASFSLGGGSKQTVSAPTLGQQLIDLKRARDAGAISPAEYEMEKAKLMRK